MTDRGTEGQFASAVFHSIHSGKTFIKKLFGLFLVFLSYYLYSAVRGAVEPDTQSFKDLLGWITLNDVRVGN